MTWLTVQILLELLLAAAFGALVGWVLRGRRMAAEAPESAVLIEADVKARARVRELENQLAAQRNEIATLKLAAPVAASAAAPASAAAAPQSLTQIPADKQPEPESTLAWRNRYLESRVRFLEGKIAELEDSRAQQIAQAPSPPEVESDESRRLRWRNRYLEGRVRYLEEELVKTGGFRTSDVKTLAVETAGASSRPSATQMLEADKPALLDAPRGGAPDDLKEIAGIGPKIEGVLNSLGVYHFDQIASWTDREIAWVNAAIAFKGRIEREKWVEQAKMLAQGVATEGQRKFRDGKHT